ncbi:hypothetical protein F383_12645 [Gossypium arboreum]|uniref:Uncharacterized protein n=1 Tax=Gossypium arboreum TaxID=29729 RepID=A0A0B0PXB9_GOSAR|nr:hypothetical protein F383_12645 [Gossypium arboreum]
MLALYELSKLSTYPNWFQMVQQAFRETNNYVNVYPIQPRLKCIS